MIDKEVAVHMLMVLIKMEHKDVTHALYSAFSCLNILGLDTDFIINCMMLEFNDELKEKIQSIIDKAQKMYDEDKKAHDKFIEAKNPEFDLN